MKLLFYSFALMIAWGLSAWCPVPVCADNTVTNLGTKVNLQKQSRTSASNNEENRDPLLRTPADIPTLLSLLDHTLYAYPENVNGGPMIVIVLDEDEANVATYTVTGTDIVPLSLPSELFGNYIVQVEAGETVYVGTLTLY